MIRTFVLFVVVDIATAAAQEPLPSATFSEPPMRGVGTSSADTPSSVPEVLLSQEPMNSPGALDSGVQPPIAGRAASLPTESNRAFATLEPTFRLRGRIEADATSALQSQSSRDVLGDLQDGFGFRRVRIGAQGSIEDSASWVSEVELAGGSVRIRDVFVGLDAIPGVNQIRIGNFREPYNLEGMTSSNFITFMERSAQNVLSPVRNWGVCSFWWREDERLLFSLGGFRDGTGNDGQSFGDDGRGAYTARLTGLPVYNPSDDAFRLVHVGAAFSQRSPPNGVLNFTRRIGSNILTVDDNPGSPFLPSLQIAANDYQLYNLQAARVVGPFTLQAEWSAAAVQQIGAGSIFVHGMYVSAGYFLTGEHRAYNRTRGSFDQVEVLYPVTRSRSVARRGRGAVEVAARFAYLDFNSANLPPDNNGNPAGTDLYEIAAGLNWYLNTNTRIMFDYTAGIPNKVGFEPTVAHICGVRTAVFW